MYLRFAIILAASVAAQNLFARQIQNVGCELLFCATPDCNLLQCGSPGFGIVAAGDCICCGGQIGCNIDLGYSCGAENGLPVCVSSNDESSPSYAPVYSAPVASASVYSAPAASTPAYSAPAASAPVYSTAAASAPVYSAPTASGPGYSAPAASTPVHSTPMASSAGLGPSAPAAPSSSSLPSPSSSASDLTSTSLGNSFAGAAGLVFIYVLASLF